MTLIRQDDLVDGNISVSRASNLFQISVTTGYTIPANNISASQGTVFSENRGPQYTYPLWIKTLGTGTQGWARESDWKVHNQNITTSTILFYNAGANTVVTPTLQNITISVGTPVGIYGAAAWSLSGNLNTSRWATSGAGSQNATLIVGGENSSNAIQITTEIFNGSAWTYTGNLNTTREYVACFGSQNAGVAAGGHVGANALSSTELFNGSAWSLSGNMIVSKYSAASAGSQNAGLVTGGFTSARLSSTELFNGSTWSSFGNMMNTAKIYFAGMGTPNSTLVSGGEAAGPATLNMTELFNGSAWSLSGLLNVAREQISGSGSVNAGLVSGGYNGTTGLTTSELFNGSSWSFSRNTNVSRYLYAAAGSQNAGLISGGNDDASIVLNTTELHNQTLYRPVNYQNYRSAKNIGIISQNPGGATATTVSVAFSGYVNNINITSNNIAITTVTQYRNTFMTLSRNSSFTMVVNSTDGVVNQAITTVKNTDIILGLNLTATETVLLGNTLTNLSPWVRT